VTPYDNSLIDVGAGGVWDRWGGSGWGRTRYLLPGARFDYEREAGDLWSNVVVACAIKWLGDRFPQPLLRVSRIDRRGNHVPLPRHDAVSLWSRPNPYYGRQALEKAIGLSLITDGNAFIWKQRSKLGRVIALWWIPHYLVAPVYPGDGSRYLDFWRVRVGGESYALPPQDVIHVRDGIDPRNDRLGVSALKAAIRDVCTVNEESTYTAAILHNAGVPGLVAMPATDQGRIDSPKAVKERLRELTTGDNRGEPLVLTGFTKIETLGFSPEQLRLDRLPANATARIAAACGVAAMSLGLPDANKTYSNLAEANRASWGTVTAIQSLEAEAIRWQLLPEFDDADRNVVEHDYGAIQELQEDLDRLHGRIREDYKAGVITRNEAREETGRDPDDLYGDVYVDGTGGEPRDETPPTTGGDDEDDPLALANGKAHWRGH
jgi:HK97 family phage portal protein